MTKTLADIYALLDRETLPAGITFDDLKKMVRAVEYHKEAAELFARLANECGEDIARAVWNGTPPRRKRGNPRRGDGAGPLAAAALHLDTFNRMQDIVTGETMTAEKSAEDIHNSLGFSASPKAAAQVIKELRRAKGLKAKE